MFNRSCTPPTCNSDRSAACLLQFDSKRSSGTYINVERRLGLDDDDDDDAGEAASGVQRGAGPGLASRRVSGGEPALGWTTPVVSRSHRRGHAGADGPRPPPSSGASLPPCATPCGTPCETPCATPCGPPPAPPFCFAGGPSLLFTPQVAPVLAGLRRRLDAELDGTNAAYRARPAPAVTPLWEGRVFLGGLPDAAALRALRGAGVRHIVNCCAQADQTDPVLVADFHVHTFECYDRADYLILHHDYEPFANLMRHILEREEKVFVHCVGGINRSVTLCCAFLVEMLQISPIAVVKTLRENGRMYILDNIGFRHQLVDFYFQVVLPQVNEEEALGRT